MSLRDVDLNLLVTLEALLRERNVTRAGHVLGASQPAMSAALARLRDMFGDQLLMRVGREYRLTPLARDLIGHSYHEDEPTDGPVRNRGCWQLDAWQASEKR